MIDSASDAANAIYPEEQLFTLRNAGGMTDERIAARPHCVLRVRSGPQAPIITPGAFTNRSAMLLDALAASRLSEKHVVVCV